MKGRKSDVNHRGYAVMMMTMIVVVVVVNSGQNKDKSEESEANYVRSGYGRIG